MSDPGEAEQVAFEAWWGSASFGAAGEPPYAASKEYAWAAWQASLRAHRGAAGEPVASCPEERAVWDALDREFRRGQEEMRRRVADLATADPLPRDIILKLPTHGSGRASPPAPAWSGERPEVVCLCGSTRFMDAYAEQYGRLTDEGKIVLSVGRVVPQSEQAPGSARKVMLDELHKRKIDLCDRVLVLNVGGYIGASTRSEIEYAHAHGKPVDYLNPIPPPGAAS